MKNRYYKSLLCGALLLISPAALRAQFSVPWFVIAGGGGTATNNAISISGTFGQWEAAPPVTNGLFSLTSGFWGFSGSSQFVVPPPPAGTTLFSDTFAGNTINPSNWVTSGNTVVQANGTITISNNAVNDGGVLTSVPFALNNSTGLITITRELLVHAAPNTVTNYGAYDFLGQFGITVGVVPPFSVDYADWDYSDGVTYLARYGFYLARDGASPILIADQANVSPPLISPTNTPWDVWFTETVTYNPTNGVMEYFTNGTALQTNFTVGVLTGTGTPTMTLAFNAFGLGTGDYQSMSNLTVTQAAGLTNTAPIIVLSGSLAFGNVTTSATNQLTISNAGNAPLIISNITLAPPLGFTLNLTNATIAPGTATNVAVVFTPVVTSNNYSATLTIISDVGTNTVPVSGFVTSGTLELLVDISGNGKVSPSDNGKSFKSGAKISLKAAPGTGAAFAGWTGSIVSIANPLVFDITNSMVLQANFVSSPFGSVAGTYDGLFGASNAAEATSGLLKGLTVSTKGVYSGTLFIDGASHALSGTFVASGQASNSITRTTKLGGPLTVAMTLDLSNTPPQITGTISNTLTAAVANLVAYRATNAGTLKYTTLLEPEPGVLGQSNAPSGYGYLLMSQKAGVLTLSGNLADGTALSQTVPVTAVTGTNEVPVFVSLYANTGLLTGWLNMAGGTTPTGTLDWIKPAAPKSLLYPGGFTNEVTAQGAVWTAPAAHTAALDLTAGQLIISGGNLKTDLIFDVSLNSANALTEVASTNNSTNSVKGTIAPATGLLTVTFGNGAGKATTIGKGAVLQDTTNGAGYFLTKTNAGSFILQQ
jgi:hypothetical protein